MGTYLSARKRLPLVLLAAAVTASAAPSSADAAPWRCEASALTGSLLNGTVALPAVKANAGALDCSTQAADPGSKLPAPLDSAALVAQTSVTGAADSPAAQKVLAMGGIADLKVKLLPELPIKLPDVAIPAELNTLSVPVPAIKDPITNLELVPAQNVNVDLKAALEALKPLRALPNVDLLAVKGAVAYASAGCNGNVPSLTGASQVAGISVLGTELPVGQVVDQTLTLLDSGNIDPSNVDVSKLDLSGVALPALPVDAAKALTDVVQPAVRQALDALPTIAIPAALAQVKVTPGEQTTAGGLLTQRALRVQVGLLGQSILDATVGEASVGAGDVNCEPAELACTTKSLVLVDVYEKKGRVKLLGVADRKFAGKSVDIVFEGTGKVVGQAKIAKDGQFDTSLPLPPRSMRSGNEARYMAVLGKEKSMNLKLERRMIVDEMVARDGKVVINGRVTGLMAKGQDRAITVTRRVSCTKMEKVGTFMPKSDGTFSISFAAPADAKTAVYRLSTEVRKTQSNPKTFPTYTLPRAVNLLGL
jgi:hypothetical protein